MDQLRTYIIIFNDYLWVKLTRLPFNGGATQRCVCHGNTWVQSFFWVLPLCLLRPKLQDSQHFSQYRKPYWWPGPVHVLAASSLLSRKRRQRLVSSAIRQQKGVFLQHHPLSLPQQVHGQKRDGESFPLPFFWFSFDCLIQFVPHLHPLLCAHLPSAGGRPGSAGVLPAGPDQRPGGHEQILCQDDEHSHLWVKPASLNHHLCLIMLSFVSKCLRNRCSIWKSKSEDVEVWGCFSSSLVASSLLLATQVISRKWSCRNA